MAIFTLDYFRKVVFHFSSTSAYIYACFLYVRLHVSMTALVDTGRPKDKGVHVNVFALVLCISAVLLQEEKKKKGEKKNKSYYTYMHTLLRS